MTLTALGEAQFLREVYDVTFSGGRRENREMDQNHPKSTDWKFLQILGTCIYIYILIGIFCGLLLYLVLFTKAS
jgi:hypothetical protein